MQTLCSWLSRLFEIVTRQCQRRWWPQRCCICVGIAVSVAFPAIADASPESYALLQRGAQDLRAGKYEAALSKFEAAARADATDAEAPFFQGVALNRLGRHYAAWAKLQQARTMGVGHP